jgi:hypothetical protein
VVLWGFYWYQKPRTNLASVKASYHISAVDLYKAFAVNEQAANQRYLGKIIEVQGQIDDIKKTDTTFSILLSSGNDMGGINCSLSETSQKKLPQKGQMVNIKGKCIGFIMDVNLSDAIINQ